MSRHALAGGAASDAPNPLTGLGGPPTAPARSQKGSHGSVERCALRIGHSLSAGAETVPVLVDRLVRSSPGLKVSAVPMATPEISPAVVDGRIDVGITRGNSRVVVCARSRCDVCASGVQSAQHHLLSEHPSSGSQMRPRIRCGYRTVRAAR